MAIWSVESGNTFQCDKAGASGELKSCLQFLPATYAMWSKETIGYVAPLSKTNEMYVATLMVQKWLDKGYSDADVLRTWNQGHRGQCKKGTNSYGVKYNSCAYEVKGLSFLR